MRFHKKYERKKKPTFKTRPDGKCDTGRPTVFSPEMEDRLEFAFKIDCTTSEACAYAGVNEETFQKKMKRDKKFRERMECAKRFPYITARKTLFKGVLENNVSAAMEFLKRRDGRYKDKAQVENDVNIDGDVRIEDKNLKELEKLREDLLG